MAFMRTTHIMRKISLWGRWVLFTTIGASCNKLVQVPNPISSVTTTQTFSTDADATSAMLGIYSTMSGGANANASISTSLTSYYCGESADELTDVVTGTTSYDAFLNNDLNAISYSGYGLNNFWQPAYYDIYCANAVINGVQASNGITLATRNQLIGEAKFIRAFSYFYLTNIFGEVPLVLSVDFNQTVLLAKSTQDQIYAQIISDLLDGENSMIGDFSLTGGQPIRANKWAAAALLARVYLYRQNWAGADSAANAVINSGLFSLVPLPLVPETSQATPFAVADSDAFWANSPEAILQLQTANNYPYATQEGFFFIPYDYDSNYPPNCWL